MHSVRRSCFSPWWLIFSALGLLSGCLSPAQHRQNADRVAYDLIQQTRQQALGRTEPFSIERASDRLRRRLLLEQKLPYAAQASLGTEDITPIPQWPDPDYLKKNPDPSRNEKTPDPSSPAQSSAPSTDSSSAQPPSPPLKLSLIDALKIAAANSRDYQAQKERVFEAALNLDLEKDSFRATFAGALESIFSADLRSGDTVGGVENRGDFSLSQRLESGVKLTTALGVDVVKLLTGDRSSSLGLTGDATIEIPLLRGSSRFVVTEPLTQAQRELLYAIYDFERFKRRFAVQVASEYLGVLQQLDQVRNAEENYRRLVIASRRVRRLADAGRQSEIQVDQAIQSELRARDRWIAAQQAYYRRLDSFKILLGLPTDARIELDRSELERLASHAQRVIGPPENQTPEVQALPADAPVELPPPSQENVGPYELEESQALQLALANRLDLRIALSRVEDAQRKVAIAADALGPELTLLGRASIGESRSLGSASQPNARLRFDRGYYTGGLSLALPWERTREAYAYRASLIDLEAAVRNVQAVEDQIKQEIRNALRRLLQYRESLRIQARAVALAKKRVASADLFLQAGRAQVRDLLEAEDALIQAQNEFTNALVNYRMAELEIQRDMDVLEVDHQGLWKEFQPREEQ